MHVKVMSDIHSSVNYYFCPKVQKNIQNVVVISRFLKGS